MSDDFVDSIACLYSATITESDGSYSIDVPEREIELGEIDPDSTIRVAIMREDTAETETPETVTTPRAPAEHPEPPVEEGDIREVTIESTGDQGDGIAKVDRGFVVIVPGARPGDDVTVKIDSVQPNYAVAEVVEEETTSAW
ncbi:TRAM domain-containing protein [Halanaeroarchaeum sulfurireducens]|nr:TRAM domain-containing protein [Halanaeroarchaeum sulfurireducens]